MARRLVEVVVEAPFDRLKALDLLEGLVVLEGLGSGLEVLVLLRVLYILGRSINHRLLPLSPLFQSPFQPDVHTMICFCEPVQFAQALR